MLNKQSSISFDSPLPPPLQLPPITNWLAYYGNDRNVLNVEDYSPLILESNSIGAITPEEKNGKLCLAYVSVTEVNVNAWYYQYCEGKPWLLSENPDWPGTFRIDPRDPEWQSLFIHSIIPKVLEKGYDGLFLDSMDVGEWLEGIDPERFSGAAIAVGKIIKRLRISYPKIIISVNNSLTPVLYAKDCINYYVIESLISTWKDNGDGTFDYVNTSQETKDWLYPRVQQIQDAGIPILDIEYGLRNDLNRCNIIKEEANSHGWHCFITDRNISTYPNPEELIPLPTTKYSFKMAKSGTDVNLFGNSGITLPTKNAFRVSVNDVATNQDYSALNFNAGDKIDIELISKTGFFPPLHPGSWNSAVVQDYIEEILEPLPQMKADSTWEIRDANNMFSFCSSLKKIPVGLFSNNKMINSYYYTFSDCSLLQSIPEKIFENNKDVTTFNSCFINCSSLTTISEDLFSYCPETTNFTNTFRHSGITTIPATLFSTNTKAETFEYCFGDCTSLQAIPFGLFDNNTEVVNFSLCFYADTGIKLPISESLFIKNTKVTNFSNCFAWCNELDRFNLVIKSVVVNNVTGFLTDHWNGDRKIYVPAGSITESTFNSAALPKTTIIAQ